MHPEPDLFIRTGGETRISNFLLWQMAYAELYFTDTLWPDFNEKSLNEAIVSFQNGNAASGGLPNSCRLSSNGVENYVKQRILTALWLLPLMLGMLFYAPMWLWAAFCGLIAMLTLWEYARMSGLDS